MATIIMPSMSHNIITITSSSSSSHLRTQPLIHRRALIAGLFSLASPVTPFFFSYPASSSSLSLALDYNIQQDLEEEEQKVVNLFEVRTPQIYVYYAWMYVFIYIYLHLYLYM